MSNDKPEMLIFEICKKGHSGFFQDDTIGTANPIELTTASMTFIPTIGWRSIEWTDEKTQKKTRRMEKIQWIKGHEEISMDRQKELGIVPERSGNQITIEKDAIVVVREGANIGFFDYLKDAYYNENAILRSEKATALYRSIKADESTDLLNENELMQADAVKYVGTLYMKKADGKYQYNETKINNLCQLFEIYADTNTSKINALMTYAKRYADVFLNKAVKFEQLTITEISHGLQLNVIKFDGNAAVYATKDAVIKNLGSVKLKRDEQIEYLADYFRSADGNAAYTEFRAELEFAKEKEVKNK